MNSPSSWRAMNPLFSRWPTERRTRAPRCTSKLHPRNPAVPVGYDPQKKENRGFNGSPGIASFYRDLAKKDSRYWRYDDTAAVAVSSAGLSWRLTLPCEAWDAKLCTNGQVSIRTGGTDAVHLDKHGCGAVRFALGLEESTLATAPPDPSSVAAVVSEYGGCQ